MKKLLGIIIALSIITLSSAGATNYKLQSPNKATTVRFGLDKKGIAYYTVEKNGKELIKKSKLWFEFNNQKALKGNMTIESITEDSSDTMWETVYGEDKLIRDNYKSCTIALKESEKDARRWNIHFKIYDDGLAFRYEFPKQNKDYGNIIIKEEHSEFNLTEDADSWWIPADYDSYEYVYTKSKISEINPTKEGFKERMTNHTRNFDAINTPFTIRLSDGTHMSIHEANLTDYAGMSLKVKADNTLETELVPWANGDKVRTAFPFVSPWRVILIASNAGELTKNNIIINQNTPSKEKDLSWIRPMKYTGIWWEMHLGISSWSREKKDNNGNLIYHGANTENALRYIDFNAENNIRGLLIEGWNEGWEAWEAGNNKTSFNFTKAYSDFDIEKIVKYGKSKGVELIGHHETGGDIANYEKQLDSAMSYYDKLGIHTVKTGYAGIIKPLGEYHHGQFMVRHYRKVVETAMKYKIMIIGHEPISDTGIRRTFPNMMSREGVRGMEFAAWGGGSPVNHTLILPFTRMLAGPIDYTPGIFDIKFDKYKKDQYVRSTVARQLADMVIIYSPLVMAADMIDNYIDNPAFQFIRDFSTDFSKSKVLEGEIGQYITMARKEKNSNTWFVASSTDKSRTTKLNLNFLDADKEYTATIYKDGPDAHWFNNPTPVTIESIDVNNKSTLDILLAEGGGFAIVVKVKEQQDQEQQQ